MAFSAPLPPNRSAGDPDPAADVNKLTAAITELRTAVAIAGVIVVHGANANVARPTTDQPVVWIGSVDPNNSDDTLDVYIPVTAA